MAAVFATRLFPFVVIVGALLGPAVAVAQINGRSPALNAEAVLLLDTDGRTVYAKNARLEHAPASLVKLMTLYLAFEDLEAKRATLEDPVVISQAAATTPRYRMGVRAGEIVPLRTLLEGVAIASANDAATAVAEHLGGDEATFVVRMNAKAAALGMTATRYANPHGLPDSTQRSTARDIALLMSRLLHDHPDARTMLGGQTFIYRGRVYARHISLFTDPGGVQALKTGFTREAGYNLAVSAWRAGQQFVMIVLGAQTRAHSFLDGKKLLRYGFIETGLETEPARPVPPPHPAPKPPVRARRTASRS
jgi:D-alanyl-D-alanine carboxypeptidase